MKSILFTRGVPPSPDTIVARIMDEAIWTFCSERNALPQVILSQSKGRYKLVEGHVNGQLYAQYEATDLPFPAELATE